MVAIVVAVCLLPTFLAGARRWPDTRIARAGISTADRVRDEADVAVTSISTWSRAGRDTVRLRKEQFQLRRERDAKIRELGQSVFEDDGRADELKAEAKELDERIAANERELQRTIAGARRRFRKQRAAVVATEVISPEESDAVEVGATEACCRGRARPRPGGRRSGRRRRRAAFLTRAPGRPFEDRVAGRGRDQAQMGVVRRGPRARGPRAPPRAELESLPAQLRDVALQL